MTNRMTNTSKQIKTNTKCQSGCEATGTSYAVGRI